MTPKPQSDSARTVTLEQLQPALDLSPVPTAILQWNQLLYLNPACKKLLGDEDSEQLLLEVLRWNDPNEKEETRRRRIAIWKTQGESFSIARKEWVRRKGKWTRQPGGELLIELRACAIPLAGGDGTQLTLTDITACRQTRLQGEEQQRLAIESGRIGTWDLDPSTGKLYWSRRAKEMFGLAWDDAPDYAKFLKLLHPEDRERTANAIREALQAKGTGEYGSDYRVIWPNGELRWIAATGRAFFSQEKNERVATRLIGTVLDITQLRKTDASLNQNEKLNVTGRLAATMAHEINNPLEAITNLLYLLKESPLETDQQRYIELAQQELARITDIATQALRFYRDPSAPVHCNIAEVLDSVLDFYRARLEAMKIFVERRYDRSTSVIGAREELRQLMMNLIHNAMDAMPHGGRLLVRAQNRRLWRNGRQGVCICIADTGHGMDETTKKRMFEPFFTTRIAVGTGLGLWLCEEIVEKHAGKMRVKTSQKLKQHGTVVSVCLPLDRRK